MNGVTSYNLPSNADFPQVEPEAGFWPRCPILCTVSLQEIENELGPATPFPVGTEQAGLAELQQLYNNRLNPLPDSALSAFLREKRYFLPPPAKAVLSENATRIENGVELASLFEGETPGLWHRHVLNVIFDPTIPGGAAQSLSPPRQALVWAALDVAIVSALTAAWHFKWLGGPGVEYRQRPAEYDTTFPVLYDTIVEFKGPIGERRIVRENPKTTGPMPSPGTPRHPAYPSGHSTYSKAASYVLGCLFPQYENDFRLLANNIGEARLYGGVHWLSDHTFGQKVGEAVGKLVIAQLNRSGIPVSQQVYNDPPDQKTLHDLATEFGKHCGTGKADFCEGVFPLPKPVVQQNLQFR